MSGAQRFQSEEAPAGLFLPHPPSPALTHLSLPSGILWFLWLPGAWLEGSICTEQPSCCWVISWQHFLGLLGRGSGSLTAQMLQRAAGSHRGLWSLPWQHVVWKAVAPLSHLEERVVGSQD